MVWEDNTEMDCEDRMWMELTQHMYSGGPPCYKQLSCILYYQRISLFHIVGGFMYASCDAGGNGKIRKY